MFTITRQEFEKDLEQFLEISRGTSEPWEGVEANNPSGYVYASYSMTKVLRNDSNIDEKCASQDKDDDQQAVCTNDSVIVKFNYHIIYDESFSVPILYFQAFHSNGSLLKIEEIWKMIPKDYLGNYSPELEERFEMLSSIVSQTEHPYLGAPYYKFHPCQTSSLLYNAFKSSEESPGKKFNSIICWLSTIAPLVGLTFDPFYAIALQKNNVQVSE